MALPALTWCMSATGIVGKSYSMPVKVMNFSWETLRRIEQFESVGSFSKLIAEGGDGVAVHCVRCNAGGRIGTHPTGREQLFLVVEGEGWVKGPDGEKVRIRAGEGVYWTPTSPIRRARTPGWWRS